MQDGILCGVHEQWMPSHELQIFDIPFFADGRRELDHPLYTRRFREWRIGGLNFANEISFRYHTTDSKRTDS